MKTVLKQMALVAMLAGSLASCKKEVDQSPINIMAYRRDLKDAETISETQFNSAKVLEDRVEGVDYLITSLVEINAKLTIKPGVTIMFEDGAGFQVNETGSIVAIGEEKNVIYFTSKSGKRSAWKGITILSSNGNVLSFCKLEHGGAANNAGKANVIVGAANDAAAAEISYCEITASGYSGVVINEGSTVNHFEGNNIHTNSAFPLTVDITIAAALDNRNTLSNNGKEFIQLVSNGAAITQNVQLKKLTERFVISGTINTNADVTINAGCKLYMDNNAALIIEGPNASLQAHGTSSDKIVIAGIYDGSGVWGRISFAGAQSSLNKMEHCRLVGGGTLDGKTALGMISAYSQNGINSKVVVRNCELYNSSAAGIYLQQGTGYNSDIADVNNFASMTGKDVVIE